jgi:hypothetical protein
MLVTDVDSREIAASGREGRGNALSSLQHPDTEMTNCVAHFLSCVIDISDTAVEAEKRFIFLFV